MGIGNEALLPTQRPLAPDELATFLASIGTVSDVCLLSGGTFSAVQGVTLTDGRRIVVKTSVPLAKDGARAPLLTYERDMLRAERDMLALVDGNGLPTPALIAHDIGSGRFGVDAIAMEWLDGTPWDRAHDAMTEAANAAAHRRVGEILAALHRHEGPRFGYPAAGFAMGGDTMDEFFVRLIDSVIADADTWGVDIHADRLRAAVTAGRGALAEVERPLLIHNDLWLGNVLLDPATGAVHGVVDFERALYADPLWDFVGGESMLIGRPTPARLAGYLAAGGSLPPRDDSTPSGFSRAADTRIRLYRLWSMAVQAIEIVPRGFSGDWVVAHRARIAHNRDALLAQAGV